jgi:hypothetical protein
VKPPPVAPSPAKKAEQLKKQEKTKKPGKPSVTVKSSQKRHPLHMEQEPLVLAADILLEPITEPIFPEKKPQKKKISPRSITEKDLEKVISKASDGITIKELGGKLEVKWQSLMPKINNLVKTNKIKKTGYKYFAKKKTSK